jgi:N-acyl homoserine lactone hydrolase
MSADPIKAVSIISTGSVKIHPEHALGTRKPLLWWILTSRKWLPPRPINVYVVEHSNGLVLFDTGQDRASVTDSDYFPKGFNGLIYSRLARFEIGPSDTLTEQIKMLGYSIKDVRKAIISHLHQDHMGGLRELLHAEIITAKEEWDEMMKPSLERRGFLREHIDIPGLRWNHISFQPTDDATLAPFDESFDLMGDGSMTLLPTKGHTNGSLSMLVRRSDKPPLLMVGDLTYDVNLMEQGEIPGVGNKNELRANTKMVLELKKNMPGLIILPAHDPGSAARLG